MSTEGVSVDALTFAYRGAAVPVLEGVSHRFETGSVTALTGESGRGKSTLLYLIGLMLRPTQGSVVIDGFDASGLPDHARSQLRNQQIGFVFQDAALDPARSVLDSVLEPTVYSNSDRAQAIARALQLLDQFEVGVRANHRPGEISGGQAQRVALCRALINEPNILLADEPTGNLDQRNSERVLALLRQESHERGRTTIIATHDPFVISRADAVVEL